MFFCEDFAESIEDTVAFREIFEFLFYHFQKFSGRLACPLSYNCLRYGEHILEEKPYIIDIPIGTPLCDSNELVSEYSCPILDSYISTIEVHYLISIGLPYFSAHIDLDIDIMLTIREYHLVSLFECTMPREYLLEYLIYRAIIDEVEVEICRESIKTIEKVTGSPSLECEMFPDITLKYLFENLEHDESVFFSIEHSEI